MLKLAPKLVIVGLSVAFAGSALAATSAESPGTLPHRFNPRSLDGPLVHAFGVDGRTWSAWAYRDGAEYDIAVSTLDDSGFWSEPSFLGRGDGRDQVEPSMIVDEFGNVYLAYTDRALGAVMLSTQPAGHDSWSEPLRVSDVGTRASTPALHIVGDRLVVAYRTGPSLRIRDLPLLTVEFSGDGIQDNPDPFGSSGRDGVPKWVPARPR